MDRENCHLLYYGTLMTYSSCFYRTFVSHFELNYKYSKRLWNYIISG